MFGHVLQSLRKLLYQVKGFKASAVCSFCLQNSKQFLVLIGGLLKVQGLFLCAVLDQILLVLKNTLV